MPLTVTEAELVARCRDGDSAAWEELVEKYSRYVYAIISRGFRLRDADAEDVHQEVFTRVHEHLDELRDDAALRPWIAQVTRRLAIDAIRRSGREVLSEEPEAGPDAHTAPGGDLFEALDEAMDLREAMATLPGECCEILDRFFARDESYRTISEALEIPQGTIASRISRCLAKLRAELERED